MIESSPDLETDVSFYRICYNRDKNIKADILQMLFQVFLVKDVSQLF